jgi:transposase
MARRPIPMIELDELFYRFQQGHTLSSMARSLGQARGTVRKYLRAAIASGLTRGGDDTQRQAVVHAVRSLIESGRPPSDALIDQRLAPYRDQMKAWLDEPDMTMKQVWRLLRERGISSSYSSLKRYIRAHLQPRTPRVTIRLETPPGRQAQVDFASARVSFRDGVTRHLWLFIMTLAYSRHRFVRFVEHQNATSWIDCHIRAFEFFGGVPETVLLDNLKAGVARPHLYDPTLNRAYAELERHYGFTVDPTRIASPQDKGQVERAVPTARQQLVAGRLYHDVPDLNDTALIWCRDAIGQQPHGTTHEPPLLRFQRDEQPLLKPLPPTPFDPPIWAEHKVHPDHHVVFQRSYYSLPTRFVGKMVWVRASRRLVQIFCDDTLVKTHPRAPRPGSWITDHSDYPDQAKAFLFAHPAHCRATAQALGPHVTRMVDQILASHAIRNLRKAQAILRLADKYGPQRLDLACASLLAFESTELKRLQRILELGITPSDPSAPAPMSLGFLHPPQSFAALEVTA